MGRIRVRLRLTAAGRLNDSNPNVLILICLVGHLSVKVTPIKPRHSISESDIHSSKFCGIEEVFSVINE